MSLRSVTSTCFRWEPQPVRLWLYPVITCFEPYHDGDEVINLTIKFKIQQPFTLVWFALIKIVSIICEPFIHYHQWSTWTSIYLLFDYCSVWSLSHNNRDLGHTRTIEGSSANQWDGGILLYLFLQKKLSTYACNIICWKFLKYRIQSFA